MTVSQIMEKMISFSNGNIHDIDHLTGALLLCTGTGYLYERDGNI